MKRSRRGTVLVALFAGAAVAAGCATTIGRKPAKGGEVSGFLGESYSLLQPGQKGQLQLRYVDQDVDWSQYTALLLEPVQFWAGTDSKLSPEAQQMLATYLYNSLKQNLEKQNFSVAELPGRGVIRLQVALSDVTKAVPVLRTVSLVVPQLRVVNQAQELVTGSYAFSGSAEVAFKATDSQTGQLLAAGVDRRSGGGNLKQAAVWQWGDAEAAIDHWSELVTNRLAELRAKRQRESNP